MVDSSSKLRPFFCGIFLTILLAVAVTAATTNRPPILNPIGPKEVVFGHTLAFTVSATDPDNDTVAYSCDSLPANASLNSKSGKFAWTPAINQVGTCALTFRATDNGKPRLSDSETISCAVIYRTVRHEKVWGFGVGAGEALIETNSILDLYPKIDTLEIDGQPIAPTQRSVTASNSPKVSARISSFYHVDKEAVYLYLDGNKIDIPYFCDIQTFGSQRNILNLAFDINLDRLAPGDHSLTLRAGNDLGVSSQSLTLSVGQLRIVDTPLSFPSPYNPSSGSPVTLQYSLSQDADLNIFIFGSSGQVVKKLSALKGSEGGKAGQNKLTWDGRTDFGTIISNGIYVGTIVDKDSQQLLGKVKLVIY